MTPKSDVVTGKKVDRCGRPGVGGEYDLMRGLPRDCCALHQLDVRRCIDPLTGRRVPAIKIRRDGRVSVRAQDWLAVAVNFLPGPDFPFVVRPFNCALIINLIRIAWSGRCRHPATGVYWLQHDLGRTRACQKNSPAKRERDRTKAQSCRTNRGEVPSFCRKTRIVLRVPVLLSRINRFHNYHTS